MRGLLAAACIFALALTCTGRVEAANGTVGRAVPQPGRAKSVVGDSFPRSAPLLVRVADAEHRRVAAAQLRLRSLGLYDGTTNGTLGPQTQAALSRYQAKVGLAVTGQLDRSTEYALTNNDLLGICLGRGFAATACLGVIEQYYATHAGQAGSTSAPAGDPRVKRACEGSEDFSACASAVAKMSAWLNTLPQANEPPARSEGYAR